MVAPLPPDRVRLAAICEALPATGAGIYLNTAAAGPLPAETARAMAEIAQAELTTGRAHPHDPLETLDRVGEARAALAALLATDLDAVALTRGTEHGLALAIDAAGARAGESVVLVRGPGATRPGWPIAGLAARGVDVVAVRVGEGPDDPDDEIVRRIGEAARERRVAAIIAPHVEAWTGRRLPLDRLADAARDAGSRLIVDAGNSIGAVPLELGRLGAAAVVFPSERWLLGPAGLGGVWLAPPMLDRMRTMAPALFGDGFSANGPDVPWLADLAALDRPSVVGFARSAGWLAMHVGLTWAWARTAALGDALATRLVAIDGVTVLAGPTREGPIVAFRIRGWTASQVLDELGPRVFAIAAASAELDAIRLSVGSWNTEDELERVAGCVALLAAHDPTTIPPRRTLTVLP